MKEMLGLLLGNGVEVLCVYEGVIRVHQKATVRANNNKG